MNIIGETMIYKNDYGYITNISRKNQNGEYENMYISVQLPKGIEFENKTKINIIKGFMTYYTTKDGLPKIKIVVMEYELDKEYKAIQEERKAIQNESNYADNYNDLPF